MSFIQSKCEDDAGGDEGGDADAWGEVCVWFDIFSFNQHMPELPYEYTSGTFLESMRKIGHMVAILTPSFVECVA